MICPNCGNDIALFKRFGDGYNEPFEEVYNCSCGVVIVSFQNSKSDLNLDGTSLSDKEKEVVYKKFEEVN